MPIDWLIDNEVLVVDRIFVGSIELYINLISCCMQISVRLIWTRFKN